MEKRARNAVTLFEMLCAMIASSVVLLGAGTIYMTAVSTYINSGTTTQLSVARANVDRAMLSIARQCFPGDPGAFPKLPTDYTCINDSNGQPTIVTYIRATRVMPRQRLASDNPSLPPYPGYPTIEGQLASAGSLPIANPVLRSGMVYLCYMKDSLNVPHPQLLQIEMTPGAWTDAGLPAAYGPNGSGDYFLAMTAADIESYFGFVLTAGSDTLQKQQHRKACTPLATTVAYWSVLLQPSGLTWDIEFN